MAGVATELGLDRSGNGNNWAVAGTLGSDQMVDTPTNNFATLNPLDSNSNITLAEGNLRAVYTSNTWYSSRGTFSPTSGKWYFEAVMPSYWAYLHIGVLRNIYNVATNNAFTDAGSWTYQSDGRTYNEDNEVTTNVPAAGAGDVMQVAYDVDAGKIWFGINNTWILSGNPTTAANPVFTGITSEGDISPHILVYGSPATGVVANFGQDSSFAGTKTAQGNQDGNGIGDFYYAPPTGFLALCTKNLPDVAVVPSEHFDSVLWTGNGSSQSISSLEFQPDFTWIKSRSIIDSHHLFDSIRGAGRRLRSDVTATENYNETAYLTSFDSDGFSLGGDDGVNKNTATYVAWNWKAGGNAASVGSNTDGSINTTDTSANVDAGFSISTWTGNATSGASVGHGLSKAPEMIINKCRSSAGNWAVYHASNTSEPETEYLELETTAATADIENIWNDQAPTNSVFYLGNNASVNGNGETFVTYCFHSVDGYSKVGSYVGNGNANGTFVYTGFKPMMVISKYTGTENWNIIDTKRSPHNLMEDLLKPDVNDAEIDTQIDIDFLSNGFKPRINSGFLNGNGHTIIYIAFAETPFKYSTAR